MKKIYIFIIAISIFGFACETEDYYYTGPEMFSFAEGIYAELPVTESESIYKVQVGATTISNVDRIIKLKVSDKSTAISGIHFTEINPLQVVIPAGETIGTVDVSGIYSGFPDEEIKDLVLEINEDNVLEDFEFTLAMQRSCPYSIADFVGTYVVVDNRYHRNGNIVRTFTYEASIELVDGSDSQLKIINLGGYGGEVVIDVDLVNKNILPVSFETQTSGYDPEIFIETGEPFGDVTYLDRGNSTIEVCNEKIKINFMTIGSPGPYSISDSPAEFTKK